MTKTLPAIRQIIITCIISFKFIKNVNDDDGAMAGRKEMFYLMMHYTHFIYGYYYCNRLCKE